MCEWVTEAARLIDCSLDLELGRWRRRHGWGAGTRIARCQGIVVTGEGLGVEFEGLTHEFGDAMEK